MNEEKIPTETPIDEPVAEVPAAGAAEAEEPVAQETPSGAEAKPDEAADKRGAEATAILGELTLLGQKVSEAVQRAWGSDERKKAEAEIREALYIAGERIDRVSEELRASEVTQDLKVQAGKMVEAVEESPVTLEIRKGLLTGLRRINEELTRLLERESTKADAQAKVEVEVEAEAEAEE